MYLHVTRVDGDEHRTARSRHVNAPAVIENDRVTVAGAPQQAEPDEVGDVTRARARDELARRRALHGGAVLDDDDVVGERRRVDDVVGDDDGDATKVGEVVPQVGAYADP